MLKTYTTKQWYSMVLPVTLANGTIKMIELRGVQNMHIHGAYTTANADEQAAIEATAEFLNGVIKMNVLQDDETGKTTKKNTEKKNDEKKNDEKKNDEKKTDAKKSALTKTPSEPQDHKQNNMPTETDVTSADISSADTATESKKSKPIQQTLF